MNNDAVEFAKNAVAKRVGFIRSGKWCLGVAYFMLGVILLCMVFLMTQNRPKEALALIPPVLLLGACIVYVHHRLKVLRHEIAQWTGRAKAHEGFPMSTSGPLSEEEYQARKQQLEATRRSSESP